MVAGLRPGQSLDDALDEFERADAPAAGRPADAVRAEPDSAAVEPEPVTDVAPSRHGRRARAGGRAGRAPSR